MYTVCIVHVLDINRVIVQQDEEQEQVDCEQDEEEKDRQAHQIGMCSVRLFASCELSFL